MKTLALGALALLGSGYTISRTITQEAREIDQRLEAAAEGIVAIRITTGAVGVAGWDRHEIRITGTIADHDDFSASSDHGHTTITLTGRDSTSTLTIWVPRHSNIDIETESANVEITEVAGIVRHESLSGSLTIDGHPRGVIAQSHFGDIEILSAGVPGFAHSEEGTVTVHAGTNHRRTPRGPRQVARHYAYDFGDIGSLVSGAVGAALVGLEGVDMTSFAHVIDGVEVSLSGNLHLELDEMEVYFSELELALDDFAYGMEVFGSEMEAWGRDFEWRMKGRRHGR
jgi:hypothetical protein